MILPDLLATLWRTDCPAWVLTKVIGNVGPDASGLGGQWEHVLDWTGNAS